MPKTRLTNKTNILATLLFFQAAMSLLETNIHRCRCLDAAALCFPIVLFLTAEHFTRPPELFWSSCTHSLIRWEIALEKKTFLKVPKIKRWWTFCVFSLQVNSAPFPLAASAADRTAHMRLNVISCMQILSDFLISKLFQPCLRVNGASANITSYVSHTHVETLCSLVRKWWQLRDSGHSEEPANMPTITLGKLANCSKIVICKSFTPFNRLKCISQGVRNTAFK